MVFLPDHPVGGEEAEGDDDGEQGDSPDNPQSYIRKLAESSSSSCSHGAKVKNEAFEVKHKTNTVNNRVQKVNNKVYKGEDQECKVQASCGGQF